MERHLTLVVGCACTGGEEVLVEGADCDLCGYRFPLDDLVPVVWTDDDGEEWERSACPECREREGLN